GDGCEHLHLRQMKRSVESVERPISHFEEIHVLTLDGMIVIPDHKDACSRLGTKEINNEPAVQELVHREEPTCVFDIRALRPVHATLADLKASSIGKDGAFH